MATGIPVAQDFGKPSRFEYKMQFPYMGPSQFGHDLHEIENTTLSRMPLRSWCVKRSKRNRGTFFEAQSLKVHAIQEVDVGMLRAGAAKKKQAHPLSSFWGCWSAPARSGPARLQKWPAPACWPTAARSPFWASVALSPARLRPRACFAVLGCSRPCLASFVLEFRCVFCRLTRKLF